MVNEASACHPTQRPTGTPPASREGEGRWAGGQARKAEEETSELSAPWKALGSSGRVPDPRRPPRPPHTRPPTLLQPTPSQQRVDGSGPLTRLLPGPLEPESAPSTPQGLQSGVPARHTRRANKDSKRPRLQSPSARRSGAGLRSQMDLQGSQESPDPLLRRQPRDQGQGRVSSCLILRQEEA